MVMSRVASVYRVGGCGWPKGWSGGEAGGWEGEGLVSVRKKPEAQAKSVVWVVP